MPVLIQSEGNEGGRQEERGKHGVNTEEENFKKASKRVTAREERCGKREADESILKANMKIKYCKKEGVTSNALFNICRDVDVTWTKAGVHMKEATSL